MLVKCKQCNKEFEKSQAEINRTTNHYCSRVCSRLGISSFVIIKCEQCGIEFKKTSANFKNTNRHFCSNECKFKDHNKQIEVECDVCGKKHFKKQDELKRNKHHYCSKECLHASQNNKVSKICPNCKSAFLVSPSMKDVRIFCSDKCKFDDWKIRDTPNRKRITCDNCGIELIRYNHRLVMNKYNYCSYECMGEHRRNDDYFEDYYDSHNWKELRLLALLRDNQKCCECGDEKSKLIIHHKIARRKGGKDEINNLITLCNTCHIKQHLKDLQIGAENVKLQNFYKKSLKLKFKEEIK